MNINIIALIMIASIAAPFNCLAKKKKAVYSCSTVIPENITQGIYVGPDCMTLNVGGSAQLESDVYIDVIQKPRMIELKGDITFLNKLASNPMTSYPALGQSYLFAYKPLEGELKEKLEKQGKEAEVELLVRAERFDPALRETVFKNVPREDEPTYLIRLYQRLPNVRGRNKLFRPKATIATDTLPQNLKADIRILKNGNVQAAIHEPNEEPQVYGDFTFGQF